MACMVAISLSRRNGCCLVSRANRLMPSENRSARASTLRPRMSSGARKDSFPLMLPLRVSLTRDVALAMPKSSSFTAPW